MPNETYEIELWDDEVISLFDAEDVMDTIEDWVD